MIDANDITGVILAGGKSSRMGQDKALLEYNGKPFIQHIAEALLQVFQRVNIISDKKKEYAFLGLPIHADIFHDSGPLGGIHSALAHATTPSVFIISCDTPFISAEVIAEMLARACPGEVTITDDGTNMHPLVGIYPATLLRELYEVLSTGRKKVRAFLERSSSHPSILKLPHWQQQLRNINTPTDYAVMNRF